MIRLDRKVRKTGPMTREAAEALALKALVFLTEDGARLSRFLGETGIDPADLSRTAGEPATLGAILAHLAQDESLLLVFASGVGSDPTDVAAAQRALTGDWPEA